LDLSFDGLLMMMTHRLLDSCCLSIRPSLSCPPVCLLSVRMEQCGSHWTDFRGVWYMSIFVKYVENIHVSLKSDKYNGHFAWRHMHISDNFPNSSQNEKCCDKSCRENQNTNFVFSNFFFPRKSCRFWECGKIW